MKNLFLPILFCIISFSAIGQYTWQGTTALTDTLTNAQSDTITCPRDLRRVTEGTILCAVDTISGTASATLTPQGSINGTDWYTVGAFGTDASFSDYTPIAIIPLTGLGTAWLAPVRPQAPSASGSTVKYVAVGTQAFKQFRLIIAQTGIGVSQYQCEAILR